MRSMTSVSPEDILSAYLQRGRNIETAAEILLSNLQGSESGASSLSSKDDGHSEILEASNDFLEKASIAETNTNAFNQKKGSASMGTAIGVIGKDYAIPKPSRIEFVATDTCKDYAMPKPSRIKTPEASFNQSFWHKRLSISKNHSWW